MFLECCINRVNKKENTHKHIITRLADGASKSLASRIRTRHPKPENPWILPSFPNAIGLEAIASGVEAIATRLEYHPTSPNSSLRLCQLRNVVRSRDAKADLDNRAATRGLT